MKKLAIFLANGFEETEAIATIDILRRAEIDVKIVSMEQTLLVTSVHNIKVEADIMFADLDTSSLDAIVLPGGVPGVPNLEANENLRILIKTSYEKGLLVAAICAAPSILANLSILDGKEATAYPSFDKEVNGVRFLDKDLVVSENIITARAMGSSMLFGLAIVEYLLGKEKAMDIVRSSFIHI